MLLKSSRNSTVNNNYWVYLTVRSLIRTESNTTNSIVILNLTSSIFYYVKETWCYHDSQMKNKNRRASDSETWSAIGWGLAGGRILAHYMSNNYQPSFNEYIHANTCRADLRHVSKYFAPDAEQLIEFGDLQSASLAPTGRMLAKDGIERLLNFYKEHNLGDNIAHIGGLGGGTASGALPYTAAQLAKNISESKKDHQTYTDTEPPEQQIAVGMWPFEYEGSQYHFNAVVAIATLLNTDIDTIALCDNATFGGENSSWEQLNARICNEVSQILHHDIHTTKNADQPTIILSTADIFEQNYSVSNIIDRTIDTDRGRSLATSATQMVVMASGNRQAFSQFNQTQFKNEFKMWCDEHSVTADKIIRLNQNNSQALTVSIIFVDPDITPLLKTSSEKYRLFKQRCLSTDYINSSRFETWETNLNECLANNFPVIADE